MNIKKIVSAFAGLTLALGCAWGAITGSGTSASPYQIASEADLIEMRTLVNNGDATAANKCWQLTADITLSDTWSPIGTASNPFSGTFDGDGHTISGLVLAGPVTGTQLGLFGVIVGTANTNYTTIGDVWVNGAFVETNVAEANYTAVVKNLVLANVSVSNSSGDSATRCTGALAGQVKNGYVANIEVSGSVQGVKGVGGVIGSLDNSVVKCCTNSATVVASIYNVGGVAGCANYRESLVASAFIDCANSGAVTKQGNGGYAGGIVGMAQNGTGKCDIITGCSNSGAIHSVGSGGGLGGILGRGIAVKVISNCSNSGTITADANIDEGVGGIAGMAIADVYGSANYANITVSANYLCGIYTYDSSNAGVGGVISGCVNEGTLTNTSTSPGAQTYQLSANSSSAVCANQVFADVAAVNAAIAEYSGQTSVEFKNCTVTDKNGTLTLNSGLNYVISDTQLCTAVDVSTGNASGLTIDIPNVTVTVAANYGGTLNILGANNTVTVNEGVTVGGLFVAGGGSTVTNNGTVTTLNLGGTGTVAATNNGTLGKLGFSDTGTYTVDNNGTISHTQSAGNTSANEHTVSTIRAGNITINNYGTIEAKKNANEVCSYALLFYNGSTVVLNCFDGSLISSEKSGFLLVCGSANSVTFNVQEGASFQNGSSTAAPTSYGNVVVQSMAGPVAQLVGTSTYFTAMTIGDAFTAAGNPEDKQVIFLADFAADITIGSGHAYSIYLNGYTMTGSLTIDGSNVNLYNKLNASDGNPNSDVGTIQNTGLNGNYPIFHKGGNVYIGLTSGVKVKATGENGTALYVTGNKVYVQDGAIIDGNVETRHVYENVIILNITGGVVNGTLTRGADTSLAISGGSFKNDPSAYLTAGYSCSYNAGTSLYDVTVMSAADILATFTQDGDGYYLLQTPADVKNFRVWNNLVQASGNFRLANDIDMEGEELPVSGNDSKRYSGTFDGNNHKISNLNIRGDDRVAFISTTQNATIKDLTLENVTVVGGANTAAIVGYMRSGTTITNCKVIGDISISGTSQVGGIAAYGYGGTTSSVTDCVVDGNSGSSITGTGYRVGGLIGCIPNGCSTVTGNSVSDVSVTAGRGYVGGLAGDVLTGSTAEVNITGNSVSNVAVVSTSDDYSDNCGIIMGHTGASASSQVNYDNAATDSSLTVNGASRTNFYPAADESSEYVHITYPDPLADPSWIKVADGFYQNGTTYNNSIDFYITSKAGLIYFRDIVNGDAIFYTNYTTGEGTSPFDYTNLIFNGKTVHLLVDVDLNNETWTPIGYTTANGKKYFYGSFDGGIYDGEDDLIGTHTVSNLKVVSTSTTTKGYYAGLFGYFAGPASIKNLTIENVSISAYDYLGAFVGKAGSGSSVNVLLDNCNLMGTVDISGYRFMGGIAGHGYCTITNCTVGGTGTIASSAQCVGSMIGLLGAGTISDCTVSNVTISTGTYRIGAIAGDIPPSSLISGCIVSNVTVTAKNAGASYTGVVAGYLSESGKAITTLADNKVYDTTATAAGSLITAEVGTANLNYYVSGDDIVYDGSGKIIGGSFDNVPLSTIAAGYVRVLESDGLYRVYPESENPAAAKFVVLSSGTESYYEKFGAALAKVTTDNSYRVQLLKDVTLTENLNVRYSCNLVLGEYDITPAGCNLVIATGKTVTTDKQVSAGLFAAADAEHSVTETDNGGGTWTYSVPVLASEALASVTVNGVTTYYLTLTGAFSAAPNGSTVQMLVNYNTSSAYTYPVTTVSITLDLNGFTFSGSGNFAFKWNSSGTLTLVDTKGGGSIRSTKTSGSYGALYITNGSVVIDGGSVEATSTGSNSNYAIYMTNGGLTVSDGSVSSQYNKAIYSTSSTAVVAISGGTVMGPIDNSNTTVTGGVFSADPSAYVVDGYAAVALTEGDAYNAGYRYAVGKIEATDLVPAEGATDKAATYNFTVVVTNGTEVLDIVTDQTITVGVDEANTVADITLNDFDISGVLASVVSAVGTGSENVTVDLRVSAASVTAETVTFEVHPEAVVTVGEGGSATVTTNALSNADLADGAEFSFKLYTGEAFAVGALVKVTHKSADYEDEVFSANVAQDTTDRYVPVTVSHFSTFEISAITPEAGMVAVNLNTGVQYDSLEDAIAAAATGDTIALLADVDMGNHARGAADDIVLEGITLDLNGYTIRGFNNGVRYSGSNAVIRNGTFDFVEAEAKPNYALSIGSYTDGASKSTGICLENLTVNGGINVDNADVTLTNVTINQGAGTFYCLWVDEDNDASATFVSGTINAGENATAVFGVAKASGGTTTDGSLNVTGGTINANGETLVLASGNHIQVSGGSFDVAVPEADCADGYIPAAQDPETGMYSVKEGSYVVRNTTTGVGYETLAEAVAAAVTGDTIQMLADETLTSRINVQKDITLDLNGRTVSYVGTADSSVAVYVYGGYSLSIEDSATGGAINVTGKGRAVQAAENAAVTISGGRISAPKYGIVGLSGTTIDISGGEVVGYYSISSKGALNISGGTLLSGSGFGLYNNGGTMTVTGGVIGDGTDYYGIYSTGSVSVSNATVRGAWAIYQAKGGANVTLDEGAQVIGSNVGLYVVGSTDANLLTHVTVKDGALIAEGTTIGIAVSEATSTTKCYGVTVDVYGEVKGPIFVSGNNGQGEPTAEETAGHAPVVNIHNGAVVASTTAAIAMNGACVVNVDGEVSAPTAIGVKRGKLIVTDNAVITSTGDKVDPVVANMSGTEPSGAAISVTSTYNSYGPISVEVTGGVIESQHNSALLVAHPQGNNGAIAYDKGVAVAVSGGTFIGGDNEQAVSICEALDGETTAMPSRFVSGGNFSSAVPQEYCASGYIPATDTVEIGGETYYTVTAGYAEGDTPTITVSGDKSYALSADEATFLNSILDSYQDRAAGMVAVTNALANMASTNAFEEAAMLNIDITKDYVEPTFKITSIKRVKRTIDGEKVAYVEVTVVLDRNGNEVSNRIYGTLELKASDDGRDWDSHPVQQVELNDDDFDNEYDAGAETAVFSLPAAPNAKIFKATIVKNAGAGSGSGNE